MILFSIFDTETTGIPRHPSAKQEVQPRIIEFGGVLLDEHGEEHDRLELLVDPAIKLPQEIVKITGITDELLRGQPLFHEVFPAINQFLSRSNAVIAHNLPFDMNMVNLEVTRCGLEPVEWPEHQICTVQENAERYGRRPRLVDVYEEATGEKLDQTHRAADDCAALGEVCKRQGLLEYYAAAIAYQNRMQLS